MKKLLFMPLQALSAQKVCLSVVLLCALLLNACQVSVYENLDEEQANLMLATLLKYGIDAEKVAAGKKGFTITVDEEKLIQSFEILHEHNLPRKNFNSLGTVFSGDSMISSAVENDARLAFALSQELADTFSRIDGVLTARVHVVLAKVDPINDNSTPPSAAVFLRHTPESQASTLVAKIRELTAKAVPGLDSNQVSVMLVPVREQVTVPVQPQKMFLGIPYTQDQGLPWRLIALMLISLSSIIGLSVLGVSLFLRTRRTKAEEGQQNPEA
jgi:type III secretion protein J